MNSVTVDVAPDGSPAVAGARSRDGAPGWLVAVAILAILAAAVWIIAALLTVAHGLDTTDEGLYLLSYRWWDVDLHSFTGAQYVYGPVFALLGHSVAALRLFRLVTVVAVHLAFGWSFMRWLRGHRPGAPASRWWEVAGTAAIVASGGMIYSWLPLTPGYNDISVLGALLGATVVVRMATGADRGSPVRPWLPASLGPLVLVVGLGKWSSAVLAYGLIALAAVVVLAPHGLRDPRGRQEVLRAAGWAIAGAVVAAAAAQLLLVPLTTVIPEMISANRDASNSGSSLGPILHRYREGTVILATEIVKAQGLLLVAAAAAALARGRVARTVTAAVAGLGLVVAAVLLVTDGDLHAGAVNALSFPGPLIALVGVAVIVGIAVMIDRRSDGSSLRRAGRSAWAVLGLLVLLPPAQAFGTNNYLHEPAILAFAAWGAVAIAVLTGVESAPWPARRLVSVSVAAAVALSVALATDALWVHPYRTASRSEATVTAAGVPPLSSVLLDPATARKWSTLRAELAPYVEPDGRAVMAFDEMPGVVFLLGGRSVGEQWYSRIDRERTATGIREACASGQAWWGKRAPILIFNRAVSDTETAALKTCGLDFANDYRQLMSLDDLTVYVPKAG